MHSFGTVIQERAATAEPVVSDAVLDRFRDIVAFATGTMVTIPLGHTYRFGDDVLLTLSEDSGLVAVFDPATRSIDWMNRRTFPEHGIHVGKAKQADLAVPQMALMLAEACDLPAGTTEIETVEAIVATIGVENAEYYIDAVCELGGEVAMDLYGAGDLDALLSDASAYARELADDENE